MAAMFVSLSIHAFAADWQRVIDAASDSGTDVPAPQNLSYFVEFPELRNLDEYICHLCSPAERAKRIGDLRGPSRGMSAEVRRVGVVKGFEIFDVFYRESDDEDTLGEAPIWKSIIVKVGPDRYREIYLYQCGYIQEMHPSVLMGPVLYTRRQEGNMGMQPEEYFWFDESGPTNVDKAAIVEAASRVLPVGIDPAPWAGLNGSYASPSLVFRIPTATAEWPRGGAPGDVEVKLGLDKGKIVITSVRYDPVKQ
jgi:hypothetical protein